MQTVDTALQIRELQAQLRERLGAIEDQLSPLQAEAAKLRMQLDLLANVLRAETEPPETLTSTGLGTGTGEERTIAKESVSDTVAGILAESGDALHIGEIRRRYLERGHVIPGRGTESNLLAYMVRDPRFIRTAKGTYGLIAENSIPVKSSNRRKRRRARKTKSR